MSLSVNAHLAPRRSIRVALILGVVAASMAVAPVPRAHADSLELLPDKTAWFWSSNSDISTGVNDPTGATTGASGGVSGNRGIFSNGGGVVPPISHGHLGVAVKDGGSDMRSYLHFPLPSTFVGSSVDSFVVKLLADLPDDQAHVKEHADAQQKPPATSMPTTPTIRACAMLDPFGPAEGDPPYATVVVPPETGSTDAQVQTQQREFLPDCSLSATGRLAEDRKTWTFNITPIAKAWADGSLINEGIGLVPDIAGVAPNWTVEFHGAPLVETVSTPGMDDDHDVTYVTEAESARAIIDFAPSAYVPPPPPVSSGGVVYPSFQNPVPTYTAPDVTPQQPVVTQPVATGTPVAFFGPTPWWFYLVLAFGVLGITWLSREIGGDPLTAEAGTGMASRVASVLRRRRLAGEPDVTTEE